MDDITRIMDEAFGRNKPTPFPASAPVETTPQPTPVEATPSAPPVEAAPTPPALAPDTAPITRIMDEAFGRNGNAFPSAIAPAPSATPSIPPAIAPPPTMTAPTPSPEVPAPIPEERNIFSEAGASAVRGVGGVMAMPRGFLGAFDLKTEPTEAWAKAGKELAAEYPESPSIGGGVSVSNVANPKWWASSLPGLSVQILPIIVASLGAAAMAPEASAVAAGALAGHVAGGAIGVADAGERMLAYQEETGKELPTLTKITIGLGAGTAGALLPGATVNRMIGGKAVSVGTEKALMKVFGNETIAKGIAERAIAAAESGGSMAGFSIVENAFEKYGYRPDKELTQGVLESLVLGTMMGGLQGEIARIKERGESRSLDAFLKETQQAYDEAQQKLAGEPSAALGETPPPPAGEPPVEPPPAAGAVPEVAPAPAEEPVEATATAAPVEAVSTQETPAPIMEAITPTPKAPADYTVKKSGKQWVIFSEADKANVEGLTFDTKDNALAMVDAIRKQEAADAAKVSADVTPTEAQEPTEAPGAAGEDTVGNREKLAKEIAMTNRAREKALREAPPIPTDEELMAMTPEQLQEYGARLEEAGIDGTMFSLKEEPAKPKSAFERLMELREEAFRKVAPVTPAAPLDQSGTASQAQAEVKPEAKPTFAEYITGRKPADRISQVQDEITKQERALERKKKSMGAMTPPAIRAEVIGKFEEKIGKLYDELDSLKEQGGWTPQEAKEPTARTADEILDAIANFNEPPERASGRTPGLDRLFTELGQTVVPGLRASDATEAAQTYMAMKRGEITPEAWDQYVEQLKAEGRVKGYTPPPKPTPPVTTSGAAAEAVGTTPKVNPLTPLREDFGTAKREDVQAALRGRNLEGMSPEFDAEATGFVPGAPDGTLPSYKYFPTEKLELEPRTFQHKRAADLETGSVGSLEDAEWDPNRAGQLGVFETKDGRFIVAHGHNRHWLATRDNISAVSVKVYREVDGWTPTRVKNEAFLDNLADGKLDALDIGQFLRENNLTLADLKGKVSLRSKDAQTGLGLSKLSPRIWDDIYQGKWGIGADKDAETYGAIVGKGLPDNYPAQEALYGRVMEMQSAGKAPSPRSLQWMIEDAEAARNVTATQGRIFETEDFEKNLMAERAILGPHIEKALGEAKNVASYTTAKKDLLESMGGSIDEETNKRIVKEAKEILGIYKTVAKSPGMATCEYINDMAEALSNARTEGEANAIKEQAVAGIYSAIAQDIETLKIPTKLRIGPEAGGVSAGERPGEPGRAEVPEEEVGRPDETFFSLKNLDLFSQERPLSKLEKRLKQIQEKYPLEDPDKAAAILRTNPKATDEQVYNLSRASQDVIDKMGAAQTAEVMKKKEAARTTVKPEEAQTDLFGNRIGPAAGLFDTGLEVAPEAAAREAEPAKTEDRTFKEFLKDHERRVAEKKALIDDNLRLAGENPKLVVLQSETDPERKIVLFPSLDPKYKGQWQISYMDTLMKGKVDRTGEKVATDKEGWSPSGHEVAPTLEKAMEELANHSRGFKVVESRPARPEIPAALTGKLQPDIRQEVLGERAVKNFKENDEEGLPNIFPAYDLRDGEISVTIDHEPRIAKNDPEYFDRTGFWFPFNEEVKNTLFPEEGVSGAINGNTEAILNGSEKGKSGLFISLRELDKAQGDYKKALEAKLAETAEPEVKTWQPNAAEPLRFDNQTGRYNGEKLERGDILTDQEGNRYQLDRQMGFVLQVDQLNEKGQPRGSKSFSVEPTDKTRFKDLFRTGENAYSEEAWYKEDHPIKGEPNATERSAAPEGAVSEPENGPSGVPEAGEGRERPLADFKSRQNKRNARNPRAAQNSFWDDLTPASEEFDSSPALEAVKAKAEAAGIREVVTVADADFDAALVPEGNGQHTLVISENVERGSHKQVADHDIFHRDVATDKPAARKFLEQVNPKTQAFADYKETLNRLRETMKMEPLDDKAMAEEIAADASSGLTRTRAGDGKEIDLREVFHDFDKAREILIEYRGEEGLPERMEPLPKEQPRPPTPGKYEIGERVIDNVQEEMGRADKFLTIRGEPISGAELRKTQGERGKFFLEGDTYIRVETEDGKLGYSNIESIRHEGEPKPFKVGEKVVNKETGEVGTIREISPLNEMQRSFHEGTENEGLQNFLEVKWNKSGIGQIADSKVERPQERQGNSMREQVAAANSYQFRVGLERPGFSYLLDMSKTEAMAEIAKTREYWQDQKAIWEKKPQDTGNMDYLLEGRNIDNWLKRTKEAEKVINRYITQEKAPEDLTAKVGDVTLTQQTLFSLKPGEEKQTSAGFGEPVISLKEFERELVQDRGWLDKMLRDPRQRLIPLYEGERFKGTAGGDRIVDAKGRPVEITTEELYRRMFDPDPKRMQRGEASQNKIEDVLTPEGEEGPPGELEVPPQGIGKVVRAIKEIASAASLSLKAKITQIYIIKNLAWMAREISKAAKALEPYYDLFAKMSREDLIKFTDTVEMNSLPELAKKALDPNDPFDMTMLNAAVTWRRIADGLHYLRDALTPEQQTAYWENYFPRLFKDPENAGIKIAQLLKSRGKSLTGTEASQKQRSMLLFSDSIKPELKSRETADGKFEVFETKSGEVKGEFDTKDAAKEMVEKEGGLGLEPLDNNYLNMMKANQWEQLRFLTGKMIEADLKEAGFLSKDKTPGHELLKGDKTLEGYYAHPDVARVLENFMSKGMRGNALFDAINNPTAFIKTLQVGLSAFHATFSIFSDLAHGIGSNLTRGIGAALTGRFDLAGHHMAELARGLNTRGNIRWGTKFIKEYQAPGTYAGEKYGETGTVSGIVDLMEKAGIRVNAAESSQVARSWAEAFRDEKTGLPRKTLDLIAWPIMNYLVPRLKINATARLLQMELDAAAREGRWKGEEYQGPEGQKKLELEMVTLAQEVARKSDNIFGQMVYDNLSMKRGLRDSLHLLIGFPGWNIGSFTDLLQAGQGVVHGVGEAGKAAGQLITGQKPTWEAMSRSSRMSLEFYLGTVITMAVAGAITQRALAGVWPEDAKDLMMPKTGALMSNGQAERIRFPTYMRDVLGMAHPFEMAKHKLNFPLRMFAEMVSNQNYFGEQIRDPYASAGTQAGQWAHYAGKSLLPFGLQGFMATESPTGKIMNMFGVTKVPRVFSNTPAMNVMDEYNVMNRAAVTSKQAGEEKQLKGELRKLAGEGDQDGFRQAAAEAMDKGKLTHQQIKSIVAESQEPTPGLGRFKALPIEWQLRAWEKASDAEKEAWKPTFLKKVMAAKPEILIRNREALVPVLKDLGFENAAEKVEAATIPEKAASKFDLSALGIRKPAGTLGDTGTIDNALSKAIQEHLNKLEEEKPQPKGLRRLFRKKKESPYGVLGF